MSESTALYRHFDVHGALLYVGISLDSIQRTREHRKGAHWFRAIARIDIDWFDERWLALAAESFAIATENPLHNVARPKDSTLKVPKGWAFAARHLKSGCLDGWYYFLEDALEMVAWIRQQMPGHQIGLVAAKEGERFVITDRQWLNSECIDRLIVAAR